jgi:hypothetical protein
MEEKNKIRIRLSISPETKERIKSLSLKFNVKPDIAVEMAVYSLDIFGKNPQEIERKLGRIETSIASLTSALEEEAIQ